METARERLANYATPPLLVAVTILTSLGQQDIAEVGFSGAPAENVLRLARLADDCGLDGVVCSPREAQAVRPAVEREFLLVTPGVRPRDASLDDQQRVMTPLDALNAGADMLVIGRPIRNAPDPVAAARQVAREIEAALGIG